jgi:hypothetical protein
MVVDGPRIGGGARGAIAAAAIVPTRSAAASARRIFDRMVEYLLTNNRIRTSIWLDRTLELQEG